MALIGKLVDYVGPHTVLLIETNGAATPLVCFLLGRPLKGNLFACRTRPWVTGFCLLAALFLVLAVQFGEVNLWGPGFGFVFFVLSLIGPILGLIMLLIPISDRPLPQLHRRA